MGMRIYAAVFAIAAAVSAGKFYLAAVTLMG